MGAGRKILIVDDEPLVRKLIRNLLESAGFVVAEAQDGPEALRIYRQDEFSLIVVDWKLPGMNGEALIRILSQRGSPVPCLVVTGSPTSVGPEWPCVGKPFQGQHFMQKVRACLNW